MQLNSIRTKQSCQQGVHSRRDREIMLHPANHSWTTDPSSVKAVKTETASCLHCMQSSQKESQRHTTHSSKELGSSEQESSKSYANHSDGKFSFPASPVTHIKMKRAVVTASTTDDSAFAEDYRRHSKKNTDYDLALTPGAEASLPLTGSNLCGTPGILRKMWMKHKKKPEYLGATNSAFEAD
ncbi:vexin isoform X2 [Alligator mississippiensis]|uniref:vexin isoform X2 n=1 Tax=Alligator mississippiensis TaxID=8496 RepID=UPI00090767E8|nr:vexin isoform X2 [Alligator mississippiensis]